MERVCSSVSLWSRIPLVGVTRNHRFAAAAGAVPVLKLRQQRSQHFSAVVRCSGLSSESEFDEDGDALKLTEADFEELHTEADYESEESESESEAELVKPRVQPEPEAEITKTRRKGRRRRFDYVPGPEVPSHLLPKVAIIGRPNVGKSALFNRIVGRKIAIVHDEPGVTRDRLYGRVRTTSEHFMLVDTGGVLKLHDVEDPNSLAGGSVTAAQFRKDAQAAGLPTMIEYQAASAVEEAGVLIFVVDGQAGVTAADIEIASWLRKKLSHKTVKLAVNKCESPKKGLFQAAEFWSLGFTPIAVSAISGFGVTELLEEVTAEIGSRKDELQVDEADRPVSIAIIGRPNVGKSSILNAIVGEERTIVSPVSGTTRDAIDTEVTGPEDKVFRLIDTAGIRKRAAIAAGGSKTESLCVKSALKAIRRADVVALVIDAMNGVTEQDYRLGDRIEKDGKACIIVINKWDTVPDKTSETTNLYEADVRERLRVLKWAPIIYTSATSGQRVNRVLEAALRAGEEREKRISTATLNQVIQDATTMKQPPTTGAGKKGRVYFSTQAAVRPPTFVFFVNDEKLFPEVYKRYLEKQLRENIGFPGTPIRLFWRSKKLKRASDSSKSRWPSPDQEVLATV